MTNKNLKTALTAVTLAAAALATSLPAHANQYDRNCSDQANSVAGGLIGGSAGAAIGEAIAGRGDRTEGAILGAIIGGIAGAAVGDGASDCEKDNRYDTRRVATTTQYPTRTTNSYPTRTTVTTHPVAQTLSYHPSNNRNTRSYSTNSYSYNNVSYGYTDRREALYRIERQIDDLEREEAYLKKLRKKSRRYDVSLERRLDQIDDILDQLKRERKRLK